MTARLLAGIAMLGVMVGARDAGADPVGLTASEPPPDGEYERDVVEVSPPAGVAIHRVMVENRYGDVTVTGHDRDEVAVEVLKRASDAGSLERLKVQLLPDPGGVVSITALLKAGAEERPLGAGSIRMDLVVRVPRAAHVVARLAKGRVEVRGVDRGAELAVDRGDILVRTVSGLVSAESSFGDQRFAEVFGELDARAVEGDLTLDAVRGRRLAATVFRGRIDGTRIRVHDVALQIAHGDVRLALEPMAGGHYLIAAWKGDVAMSIGGKVAVRVSARAASRLDLPRRLRTQRRGRSGELVGYLGSGASPAMIDLTSRAGNVTLAEF